MIWVKTHFGYRYKGGKLHAGYLIPYLHDPNAFWTACNNSYAKPANEDKDGNMEFCKRCEKVIGAEVVKWELDPMAIPYGSGSEDVGKDLSATNLPELDGLYNLAEGIVLCAQDDAVLVGCDPDRGLYNKKETERVRQDAQWFLSEIKGRMPLGTLESVWSTILERRDLSPMTMPMFQFDDGPRQCTCCGKPKDETEFSWMTNRGGPLGWCKDCQSKHYEHTIRHAENARSGDAK